MLKIIKQIPLMKKFFNTMFNHANQKIELFLNLSTACNYNCIFCNRSIEKKIVRLKEIVGLDELLAHASFVDITGYGEITAHPDFEELLDYFSKRNAPVRFVTNGSLLDQRLIDKIVKSKIFEIVFSINTLNAVLYKDIHRNNADLNRVLQSVEYLRSKGPWVPIRLSFVITARNIHEIKDFIDYANRISASSVTCLGLTPTLKDFYPDDLIIENTHKNRRYLREMDEYAKSIGVTAFLCDLNNQQNIRENIEPDRLQDMVKGCDWIYTKFFVEPDGHVSPCCWSQYDLGNIKQNSFLEIWQGARYKALRDFISKGDVRYCRNCRRLN